MLRIDELSISTVSFSFTYPTTTLFDAVSYTLYGANENTSMCALNATAARGEKYKTQLKEKFLLLPIYYKAVSLFSGELP